MSFIYSFSEGVFKMGQRLNFWVISKPEQILLMKCIYPAECPEYFEAYLKYQTPAISCAIRLIDRLTVQVTSVRFFRLVLLCHLNFRL